jgi:scyllo-inositol 2-dehydrogenase (NADP+)
MSGGATTSSGRPVVRVGLCGIGRTGAGRIRSELLGTGLFDIVACHDLLPDRAQRFADETGAHIHATFQALLADPSVELVIIATRSDTHAALARTALSSGKHVVVEKPMATTLADADALIAHAARSRGRLFARHNRRFDPPFVFAREVLDAGLLGRLHSVQLRVGEYVRRSDWQTLSRFGGGQLLNWGPHVIDWAVQLIGGRAEDIHADCRLIAAAGDAEDHVKLVLRGPTGTLADLEISGASALKLPPFSLFGDRGALIIDGSRARLRYLRSPPDRAQLTATDETPGQDDKRYKLDDASDWIESDVPALPRQNSDFWTEVHRTLRKGSPFPITLDQAREVMRIIDYARSKYTPPA